MCLEVSTTEPRNSFGFFFQEIKKFCSFSWRKHCTLDESKTLIGLELNSDSSDESMSEEDSLAVAVHPFGRTLINSM